MTDIVDGYVAERARYFRQVAADAKDALEFIRQASKDQEPVVINAVTYYTLANVVQVFNELAYGLDEACAALKFYASADTWKEVPDHTFAAQDVGLKARVALARINPV